MTLLSGIRVLDLSLQLPGPFCTMMMADYGADVVKIDEPSPRVRNPFAAEEPGTGPVDRYLNRGKRSVTINLKTEEGQEIFRKMAATADVVVEGFRPGVVEAARHRLRYGLGGQPEDRLLLDIRVRAGRPDAGRRRATTSTTCPTPGCWDCAGAKGGRPDASSGAAGGRVRRFHDGALRDPHGAPWAGADRQGGAGGRLHDGRGDGLPCIPGGQSGSAAACRRSAAPCR